MGLERDFRKAKKKDETPEQLAMRDMKKLNSLLFWLN